MEKSWMDAAQLERLLQTVSQRLGTSPEALRSALEQGKLEKVSKNMKPEESQKLQTMLGNPKQLEKLMESPQAKALYEKLTGKK
jgi:hypothetical protein